MKKRGEGMATIIKTDHKAKAENELRNMREFCQWRGVSEEIAAIRENLDLAGLGLADIGTSEDELQDAFITGNKSSAKHWLKAAKERYTTQDVSREIAQVRSRLKEAKLSLADIDSSEEELTSLLSAYKPTRKGWTLPFMRHK